jgi:hypothetical protein
MGNLCSPSNPLEDKMIKGIKIIWTALKASDGHIWNLYYRDQK